MSVASNTILVIDDDEIVRDSIGAYLSQCSFNVLEAEDGKQGLATFHKQKPDLILCDICMPQMDGFEVLRDIRKDHPHMPFIVASGAGGMTDAVKALRLGANDFIIKPIEDLAVLEYAINRALEWAKLAEDNKRYHESLEKAIHSLEHSLHLLREDQKAGRKVQMRMLPQEPLNCNGYQIDHHIIPSLYLSGDFVDYFLLKNNRIAFYLADVSGHGASSAFITVLLKHMSISLLQEHQKQNNKVRVKPSHVLSYINNNLLKTDLGKHVAVFGGIVDIERSTLTYSFGGHYPLPILSTENETRFIQGSGLPVGLFENARFEDVTIDLPPAFTLTLFSDGILEVLPDKNLHDKEEHLLSALREGAHSVQAISEQLNLNIIDEAPDDIALLVLTRS